MNNKINIAEMLKDCPKGMKLYSPLFGEVTFVRVTGRTIDVQSSDDHEHSFCLDGRFTEEHKDAECLLFPSKDQRDWSKFKRPFKPKFKVGDRLIWLTDKNIEQNYHISEIKEDRYLLSDGSYLLIKDQDNYEAIPNKFDINTLKPFDKVLVRDAGDEEWTPNLFGYSLYRSDGKYQCVLNYWDQCIPYEGNGYLLGSTDDCDEFYINWE